MTYSFDKNGRISVNAKEKTSGKAATIDIERRGTLSDQQIETFAKLASEYKVE